MKKKKEVGEKLSKAEWLFAALAIVILGFVIYTHNHKAPVLPESVPAESLQATVPLQ